MVKLKSQKGITMVALITTIVLFALILSAVSYSSITSGQIKKYNSMCADIINLQDKIDLYYLDNDGRLPVDLSEGVDFHNDTEKKLAWLGSDIRKTDPDSSINERAGVRNINDGDMYYPINEKTMYYLGNMTLNLSKDTDRYWVNADTHTVYYETGVRPRDKGQLIHTIDPEAYAEIKMSESGLYNADTDERIYSWDELIDPSNNMIVQDENGFIYRTAFRIAEDIKVKLVFDKSVKGVNKDQRWIV